MKTEFGAMGIHESNALKGDIYTTASRPYANDGENNEGNPRGKVIDLLSPIFSLVVCCRNRHDLYRWFFLKEQIL